MNTLRANVAYLALAFVLLVLGGGYYLFFRHPALSTARFTVGGREFSVEIAETTAARMQGLSGRESLGSDQGMLFLFRSAGSRPFWMKDMKFPLDFVWIAGDRVVGTTEHAPPEQKANWFSYTLYYPPLPADKVLEVSSGTVAKYRLKAGDAVEIPPAPAPEQ